MAKWLLTDGTSSDVFPTNGKDFTLEEMQALVADGGTIEMMGVGNGEMLIFDENGKNNGLPYNELATKLVMSRSDIDTFGPPGSWSTYLNGLRDFIVGPALLCTMREAGDDETE